MPESSDTMKFFTHQDRPGHLVGIQDIPNHHDAGDDAYCLIFKRPYKESTLPTCTMEAIDGENVTQVVLSKEAAECLYTALKEKFE